MVMDALPRELGHWQANALYILGDRDLLQDIPEDLYPSCMFVPIVVRIYGSGLRHRVRGSAEPQISKFERGDQNFF